MSSFKVAFGICLAVALVFGFSLESGAANLSITFDSDRLSADVSKISLQAVLTTLSEKTGITIYLDPSLKSKML